MTSANSGELDPAQFEPSFELLQAQTKIARLEREVSIQAEQLDERETLLDAMSNELVAKRAQTQHLEEATKELEVLRSESAATAQEMVQIQTKLEAAKVERRQLLAAVEKAQQEKSLLDTKRQELTKSLETSEETCRKLERELSRVEGERDSQSQVHKTRAKEVDSLRDDAQRIAEVVENLRSTLADTSKRLSEAEGLAERQRSHISFYERRIAKLEDQSNQVELLKAELAKSETEIVIHKRTIKQLKDDSTAQRAETEAAKAAVDAIATDSAERLVLLGKIRQLKAENDLLKDERHNVAAASRDLVEKAKRLKSARSAKQSEQPKPVAQQPKVQPQPKAQPQPKVEPKPVAQQPKPVAQQPKPVAQQMAKVTELKTVAKAEMAVPKAKLVPAPEVPTKNQPTTDTQGAPKASVQPSNKAPVSTAAENKPDSAAQKELKSRTESESTQSAKQPVSALRPSLAELEVRLRQPEAVAIVDARSSCSELNIDPVELLTRIEWLRDHYRIPVHLVATPLATPRNGYPERHAIGIHTVEGTETVAGKILELTSAFPKRPVVVVTADPAARQALAPIQSQSTSRTPLTVEPAGLLALRTS